MSDAPSDEIPSLLRARRFELVDAEGRLIAFLGLREGPGDAGLAGLFLCDRHGLPRAWLSVDEVGAVVAFADEADIVLMAGVEDRRSGRARPFVRRPQSRWRWRR